MEIRKIGERYAGGIYAGDYKVADSTYQLIIYDVVKKLPFFNKAKEFEPFDSNSGMGWINQKNFLNKYNGRNDYSSFEAYRYCIELKVDDYQDWYLPSKNELKKIYDNLNNANLIGEKPRKYWSSSIDRYSDNYIFCLSFNKETGRQIAELKMEMIDVLPIRHVKIN